MTTQSTVHNPQTLRGNQLIINESVLAMVGEVPKAAIVISTVDRPGHLIRQLSYYANLESNHTIYVGDSSDSQGAERIQEAIRRLEKRINIDYIHLPRDNPNQAIGELLTRVQEPYAAFVQDDSFLVPASLDKCALFLETNTDFQSAHGVATSFALGTTSEYGEVADSIAIPQRSVEHASPRLRLMDLLQTYWPIGYSVQRLDPHRKAVGLASGQSLDNFRKLLIECLSVVHGKAKELDCLYLVSQRHYQYKSLPGTDAFDWITGPSWADSYGIFSDCLAKELARQEKINLEEAKDVVKQAFWSYLGKRLNQNMTNKSNYHTGSRPNSRIMRFGKLIPGARWAYYEYQKWRVPELDSLSLQVLLSRSSPYHTDFMPVYEAANRPFME